MCHPGERLELRARRGDAVATGRRGEQEQRIGPDAVPLGGGVVGEQSLAHERGEDPVRGRRRSGRPPAPRRRASTVASVSANSRRIAIPRSIACVPVFLPASPSSLTRRLSHAACRGAHGRITAVISRPAPAAFRAAHSSASSSYDRTRSRWSWVIVVISSSSASGLAASTPSWSATRSGDPTNCVSSRSCTSAWSSSDHVIVRASSGVGNGIAPSPLRMLRTHGPYPVASSRASWSVWATTTSAETRHVRSGQRRRWSEAPTGMPRPPRAPSSARRGSWPRRGVLARPATSALSPPLLPRIQTSSCGVLAGHDVCLGAVRATVGPGDQRQHVVDLLGVVRCLGVRLLEQADLECDAGRPDEVGERERRRDHQAVLGAPTARRCRRGRASPSRWSRRWPSPARSCSRLKPDRPSPRSIRPGWTASRMPNCSTTASGVWCPIRTAPEPTRIVRVALAISAMSSAGVVPATPGLRWCSATQ